MNKPTALLPCPFCGQEAKLDFRESGIFPTTISCGGDLCRVRPEIMSHSLDQAIAAWNTRALTTDATGGK